jgi:hypothetical protein
VVVQVSSSQGIEWELQTTLESTAPEKLLFYSPTVESVTHNPFLNWVNKVSPELALTLARRVHLQIHTTSKSTQLPTQSMKLRQDKWSYFVARFQNLIPKKLPADIKDTDLLYFDSDWTPQLLTMTNYEKEDDKEAGDRYLAQLLTPFIARFRVGHEDEKKPRSVFRRFISTAKNYLTIIFWCMLYLWFTDLVFPYLERLING